MRVYAVVEGYTEESIVKRVLYGHLANRRIYIIPIAVTTSRERSGKKHKGGNRWSHYRSDINRLRGDQPGKDVRFTTLVDLYRIGSDFPRYTECRAIADSAERATRLEEAMAEAINDTRFIPYIQRHETEALVLGALDNLESLLDPEDKPGVEALRQSTSGLAPEAVDDGATTAPSKRLEQHVPTYRKALHGPEAIASAGLVRLRQTCPRFHAWVARLENLTTSA
jgi:hypothetical protein